MCLNKKLINFRGLKVFSFEMRIAFFSIIEGFGCFGMGISFNLRYGDDLDDNDDDDDGGGGGGDGKGGVGGDGDGVLTTLFRFYHRSAGISGTCGNVKKVRNSIYQSSHFFILSSYQNPINI